MHAQNHRPARAFVDYDPVPPDMQELIADYLSLHEEVTFVDLEEDIAGFSGDFPLKAPLDRNVLLWDGLSGCALQALSGMERAGTIEFVASSERLYKRKGRRILCRPIDDRNGKKLHWTPVVVRLRTGLPGEEAGDEGGA